MFLARVCCEGVEGLVNCVVCEQADVKRTQTLQNIVRMKLDVPVNREWFLSEAPALTRGEVRQLRREFHEWVVLPRPRQQTLLVWMANVTFTWSLRGNRVLVWPAVATYPELVAGTGLVGNWVEGLFEITDALMVHGNLCANAYYHQRRELAATVVHRLCRWAPFTPRPGKGPFPSRVPDREVELAPGLRARVVRAHTLETRVLGEWVVANGSAFTGRRLTFGLDRLLVRVVPWSDNLEWWVCPRLARARSRERGSQALVFGGGGGGGRQVLTRGNWLGLEVPSAVHASWVAGTWRVEPAPTPLAPWATPDDVWIF